MAKKEYVIILSCPFCKAEIWFNTIDDLTYHFYHEHNKEALEHFALTCEKRVEKKNRKWLTIADE